MTIKFLQGPAQQQLPVLPPLEAWKLVFPVCV